MSVVKALHRKIVSELETAGEGSLYAADANEPDPRYKGYGVRARGKALIIRQNRLAMRNLSESEKLELAHRLVESRYGEQQSVALHILEGLVSYFTPEKFAELDHLVRCLHGWSKIDSYTGSLLRDVLLNHPEAFIGLLRQWNVDADLWLRRASVVLFTRKVAKSGRFNDTGLSLCDNLKFDPEDLVLKGVGWSLKDMMKSDKDRLLAYTKALRKDGVSSVVTRYAIRDLKGAERTAFLGNISC